MFLRFIHHYLSSVYGGGGGDSPRSSFPQSCPHLNVKKEPKKVWLVQKYWEKESSTSIYIHPTYKRWTSDLESWTSDLQKLNIRPTTVKHPTYNSWTSDLQSYVQQTYEYYYQNVRPASKLNIRPTILEHQTNSPAPEHPIYNALFNRPTSLIIRTSDLHPCIY